MISRPTPSFDALPGPDQVGQSSDPASEIAASFAALLVGLQQPPQAALQLTTVVPTLPATNADTVETVTFPAQSLSLPGAVGASYRLADFPTPLSSRPDPDALPAKPAASSAATIPAPQIVVDSAAFGLKIRTEDRLPPAVEGVQAPAAPVARQIPPSTLEAALAAFDVATLTVTKTVAPVTPETVPTTAADHAPPQAVAVPVAPETRAAVVESLPAASSVIASEATQGNPPPMAVAWLTGETPAAPPAPPRPVRTLRAMAVPPFATPPVVVPSAEVPPAATKPAAAVIATAQPQHDLVTGVTGATPPLAAASTKAAVKAVTAAWRADGLGDGLDEPADSAPAQPPLPSASAPHVVGSPVAVSDVTPAIAPAQVSSTTSASGVRETVTPDSPAPTVTHLRVELAPPLMGEVVLELRHEREEIKAAATVDRPATAEALKLVQAQVQQVLADQGIHVGSFEVSCRDGRQGNDNRTPSQPSAAERSEPQVSVEPRKAASEPISTTLVDRYA